MRLDVVNYMENFDYREFAEKVLKGAKSSTPISRLPRLEECTNCDQIWAVLFHKAGLMFGHQVKRVNGRIVRVVCFGADWKDKLFAKLESVDGVPSKCSSIEEIRLVSTRVTAKGIEQLKHALPGAKIVIVSKSMWMDDSGWASPEYPEEPW